MSVDTSAKDVWSLKEMQILLVMAYRLSCLLSNQLNPFTLLCLCIGIHPKRANEQCEENHELAKKSLLNPSTYYATNAFSLNLIDRDVPLEGHKETSTSASVFFSKVGDTFFNTNLLSFL